MSKKDIKVPNIGEFKDVEVIEVLIKKGQKIKKNDPLITIESDKSSVEIPSSDDGTIISLNVKIGDKVSEGDKIIEIESEKEIKETSAQELPKSKLPGTEQWSVAGWLGPSSCHASCGSEQITSREHLMRTLSRSRHATHDGKHGSPATASCLWRKRSHLKLRATFSRSCCWEKRGSARNP